MSSANELAVYSCPKVANPPVIDGNLDDEAWRTAPPVTLVLCEAGRLAVKLTTARMCWDDDNLYVAFECADEDIWGTLANRDDHIFNEEVVEVFLCPHNELSHYFEINVSPRNVVFDGHIFNQSGRTPGAGTDHGWDSNGLRTAVIVDGTLDDRTDKDRGWTVEMAIPFADLDRDTPKPGERWRANLYRIDLTPPPAEYQAWSPTLVTPAAFHVPQRFGTIFFVGA